MAARSHRILHFWVISMDNWLWSRSVAPGCQQRRCWPPLPPYISQSVDNGICNYHSHHSPILLPLPCLNTKPTENGVNIIFREMSAGFRAHFSKYDKGCHLSPVYSRHRFDHSQV